MAQVLSLEELLGTKESWHYALSAYIFLVIICFSPYTWLPESPKYLYIVAGKQDEARKGNKFKLIDHCIQTILSNWHFFCTSRTHAAACWWTK